MPRFAKARDANEKEVVAALVAAGWSVDRMEPVGRNNGLPDLVLGKQGRTTLAEVKRPAGPRGGTKGKRLTPVQEVWHRDWKGSCVLVLDAADNAENVARAERWLLTVEGICPCQSDLDEPGPHIAECPYSDPEYDNDPFGIAEYEHKKRAREEA